MDIRGYCYSDANKYVVGMRFRINLTQNFQSFLRYLYVSQDQRPESPKQNLENNKTKIPEITLEQKPEIKLEDTFQVKLRKKKLKKTIGPKQVIDELSPDDAKLQDAMEKLYSQVKKSIPQLEKTWQMIEKIVRNIIDNPEELKFRSIKTSNENFKDNILKFNSAIYLLEFHGFYKIINENGEEWYSFPQTTSITTLKNKRLQAQKWIQNYISYKKMKRIK